jgi:HK97 family phage major capsid protein
LKDGQQRPLLQPDPTNATLYRVLGREVRVLSDAQLPNATGTATTAPIYIGDGTQYACLFTKEGFEFVSTDVGGNAFRTDSTEVRGLIRLGVSKFDTDAMVLRTIAV